MSTRINHAHDLPLIAKAIQEYKTTHQTQKECAVKHNIPYKVFSYYFLNGFKKNQKVGGGLIPEETPYQKKAKGRVNNYEVILVGGDNPTPQQKFQQPHFQSSPVSHQYNTPPSQTIKPSPVIPSYTQPKTVVKKQVQIISSKPITHVNSTMASIKEKLNAATTVSKDGKKRVDLDFIFDD
jgi:hypothetical protein